MKRKNILPPWSFKGDDFFEKCNKCAKCIELCPKGIIKNGSFNYPKVEFTTNYCDFCRICVENCPTNALDIKNKPFGHKVEIKKSCLAMNAITCRVCADSCEEEAIEFKLQTKGRSNPVIDIELCNGCGECLVKCVNNSITIKYAS